VVYFLLLLFFVEKQVGQHKSSIPLG
jgi:hypothetical protein